MNIRWFDKVRNEDLWQRANQDPINIQIKKRKWHGLASASFALWVPFEGLPGDAAWWFPQCVANPCHFLFLICMFMGSETWRKQRPCCQKSTDSSTTADEKS
jgi:hypothetical protein